MKKLQQKSEREIYRLREELQSREINLRMLEDREMDAKGNKTPKKKGKQLESGRKTPTGKGKSPTSMLQSVGPIPAKRMRQSLLTKKKKL